MIAWLPDIELNMNSVSDDDIYDMTMCYLPSFTDTTESSHPPIPLSCFHSQMNIY